MSRDRYVRPYLLRPLRSYEQVLRERERRESRAKTPGAPPRHRVVSGETEDTAADNGDPEGKNR